MAMEMGNKTYKGTECTCGRCGRVYPKQRGYFSVSYADFYRGTAYLPICKDCVDKLYNSFLEESKNPKLSVRQMCRKLDLYWDPKIYDSIEKRSSMYSAMTAYMTRLNAATFAGKSYDDTLREENSLWLFPNGNETKETKEETDKPSVQETVQDLQEEEEQYTPTDEVIAFWGTGYPNSMYKELEQRREYYMSRLPNDNDIDIGAEILIRQICNLDITIAKTSAAGGSIDKMVNSLNTLVGSLNLKPAQKNKAEDLDTEMTNTPLGVWLWKYENQKPLPEIDEDLKDVNKIKKYIFTWMGHLCKMLGVKNGYTKMYEDEINRLKVEKPEYDGDEEDLLIESYSAGDDDDKS